MLEMKEQKELILEGLSKVAKCIYVFQKNIPNRQDHRNCISAGIDVIEAYEKIQEIEILKREVKDETLF